MGAEVYKYSNNCTRWVCSGGGCISGAAAGKVAGWEEKTIVGV